MFEKEMRSVWKKKEKKRKVFQIILKVPKEKWEVYKEKWEVPK